MRDITIEEAKNLAIGTELVIVRQNVLDARIGIKVKVVETEGNCVMLRDDNDNDYFNVSAKFVSECFQVVQE